MPTITSGNVTLIDLTDTKKIDVHITSNYPTVQIYDSNNGTYTPNWTEAPLVLTPIIYADSKPITDDIGNNFSWTKIKGNETTGEVISTSKILTISANDLDEASTIRYKCTVTYNEEPFSNEITFARVNTGKDGSNGSSAPAVRAQYSANGSSGWTATLNTSTHKYIRLSYDNGVTWPSVFKIAGEDGQSVQMKGVAYAKITPITGQSIDLYSDINTTTGIDKTKAENGDSYLVDGYLCVYNGTNFICTGKIQGPTGQKGDSYYLFIRYADDQNGNGIKLSPVGKKYIGFCSYTEPQLPDDFSTDYNTWKWSKYVGDDAKSISLIANTQVFRVDKDGEVSPSTLTVTPQTVNTSITKWEYSKNGGTFSTTPPAGVVRGSDGKVTITGASMEDNSISIKMGDGTYSDTLTVYKVYDGTTGTDAPIAFLTNESIGFAANANGQIPKATVYSHVVAYTGATKVTPTIDTIKDLPAGMTIGEITVANNELIIPIKIADNATLGDTASNNGIIEIPVLTPVVTRLKLSWSKINSGPKGETGAGINSVTVDYGVSDSASIQPADNTWQPTIPVVAEGKYLWTRTIIDYADDTVSDTIALTYAKQGVKGDTGSQGSSVTVSKIEYQSGTSSTIAPTGNWSSSVIAVAEGSYLWTKTTFSDGKVAYGVAKQGMSGRGISKITEYYLATTASSGVTTATDGWTTTIQSIDNAKKYLWNYEVVTYTDGATSPTTPVIIGVFGNTGATGKGINSVAERYLATASSSGVTTSTTGWTPEIQTLTATKKYLWNYEIITYTDGTTSTINPVIIGVYGDKGDDGIGINSTTIDYGVSDSATVKPITWQQDIPVVAEGKYLWTRTIIDYTDTSKADTVTYVYTKQGSKGDTGTAGTSVTVKSIKYQSGTSATTAPTGTWSDSVVAVTEGNYLWTQTTFSDNKVAYGVAKQGKTGSQGIQGPKGNDAYTVILTNESHIFAGDISNAIAGSATTQALAYNGSTAQTVTIVSVNGKTAATTDTDTGIAGLKFKCSALSGTSPTITFTCTTSFVSKSGSIPIVLSVGGVQFTKMFTYSIAFKGATGAQGGTGTPASLVDITPSALYFKSTTGKDGTFTPDYIYLYPRFQTVTYSKWEYSTNGGTTWVTASGANGLSIGTYNSVANTLRIAKTSTLYTDTVTSISFRCVSSNASVYDTVSVAKIYDVVDLQIEGRNLLLNSGIPVTNSTYNIKTYELTTTPIVGETYTLTLKGKLGEGKSHFSAYNSGGNVTLAALTRVGTSDLYTKTFTWTNGGRTDLDKSVFIYAMANSTVAESTIEWIKLEKGTLATDWTPAPEDYKSITFQLYAPKGYLITNDVPEVILQTFAYDGGQAITGATFEWYSLIDNAWTIISEASGTSLTLNKNSVLKSNVYKCKMTYKGKIYEATSTVEDKTDIYESIMCISSNARGNDCYWVLYTLVYSDTEEVDPLLGPISINAPTSPVNGDYWYAVDETNASAQLKKYNGTSWVNSTDTQSLSYYWDIVNNGSEKVPFGDHSKVQVVSCNDFTATATLVCGVNNVEDGLLTQSSLSLTDASDPIVSTTEPVSVVDGQIWIKPNNNGTYIMSIWDATKDMWVVNDMDTRTKVHTSKPSTYSVGDLWITASDTEHSDYLEGTLLMASTSSSTFSESHWSTTLKYDKDLDSIKKTLNDLSQYVNITSEGLKIGAQSASGEISPFTSLFTSTELAFYQNSDKLLTLSNNQLTAPHIVVEDDLEVGKTISLGNLNLTIETNGSFSFTVTK